MCKGCTCIGVAPFSFLSHRPPEGSLSQQQRLSRSIARSRTRRQHSVQLHIAPARPMRRESAQTPRTMKRRGAGVSIDGGHFDTPGALWYFLAREKVHLAQMITSSRGLHLNTGCSLFICLLAVMLHLLSRSRERSKEGQRGCQNCAHGLSPPLDSPRPHIAVFARSCTPLMGLAGAYRYLYIHLFVGAAGPCTASRRGRNCTFPCGSTWYSS